MFKEVLRNTKEFIRTIWDTRGDSVLLYFEVKLGITPPFEVLEKEIGSMVAALSKEIHMPTPAKEAYRARLLAA